MTSNATRTTLIDVIDVTKSFPAADGSTFTVLGGVNLTIMDGEVVALLGKSGSGKSTLLRTIAGLIAPTSGEVRYRGKPLNGANPGTAMVFQSFALMPWLTVQDNVELGLQAAGVPAAERRERALAAIDSIGLDGFESAYPRELSGGMKQRVGFARAFVLAPDLLLMDEPFSALDVLTSENLRNELTSMWSRPDFPTRTICIVTHNIEEAVQLADRVLVLGSNPGHIKAEVRVELPRPRDRHSGAFEAIVDELYGVLTGRDEEGTVPAGPTTPLSDPLPDASVGGLAGLVEILHAHTDGAELPDLAADLLFEVDDLLPLLDAGMMLGFITVTGKDAKLTDLGRRWAEADILVSKEIFAQAAQRAPLVRTIVSALERSGDGSLSDDFFRDLLRRGFAPADLDRQLRTAIDWGRYSELFDYDAGSRDLTLTTAEARKPVAAAS